MFCFDKDIFSSPRSPLNKRSIHRRSFLRQILQAAFLAGLLLAIFLVGRQYIWPRYVEYDSEELTGLVQKFCGKQQTNGDQQPSADQKKREYDLTSHLHPEYEPDQDIPEDIWQDLPVRGAFYMLVRNQDLQAAREAMRSVQDRFKNQRYPWVLLSNQDFSVLFRRYIRKGIKAPIYFGKIDSAAWEYPSWIDVPLAEQKMLQMVLQNNVYKGGSLSFHQLLRYQAGLFFHHPLFRNVEYVWRVEPGSSYSCDLVSDPFLFMKQNNKTLGKGNEKINGCLINWMTDTESVWLGFTLTMREAPESITSLWSGTQKFMTEKAHFVLPHNETIMPWIMSNQNEYNYCHMWSNFEIVDLNFLRSRAYQEYFGFLDRQGGFFYER